MYNTTPLWYDGLVYRVQTRSLQRLQRLLGSVPKRVHTERLYGEGTMEALCSAFG
jgi:hypothetical protein